MNYQKILLDRISIGKEKATFKYLELTTNLSEILSFHCVYITVNKYLSDM